MTTNFFDDALVKRVLETVPPKHPLEMHRSLYCGLFDDGILSGEERKSLQVLVDRTIESTSDFELLLQCMQTAVDSVKIASWVERPLNLSNAVRVIASIARGDAQAVSARGWLLPRWLAVERWSYEGFLQACHEVLGSLPPPIALRYSEFCMLLDEAFYASWIQFAVFPSQRDGEEAQALRQDAAIALIADYLLLATRGRIVLGDARHERVIRAFADLGKLDVEFVRRHAETSIVLHSERVQSMMKDLLNCVSTLRSAE